MSRLHDRRQKRKAPPGKGGATKNDCSGGQIEGSEYNTNDPFKSTQPDISRPNNPNLISVPEACRRSGENPAAIIRWCLRHKIGGHVKAGKSGNGGAWMVDPDRLQELLEEQREPAP